MNYKLSAREKTLLKILIPVLLLFALAYSANNLSSSIKNSKNLLLTSIDDFNNQKQYLSQLKLLLDNKNVIGTRADLIEILENKSYEYEVIDQVIYLKSIDQIMIFELLQEIEEGNIPLLSFNLKYLNSDNLELSISVDE
tara:strand:- start:74 stop:493 length:420 start_codon:yes stop_codon:yes gene_type:complete